jgi:hypothetical protein
MLIAVITQRRGRSEERVLGIHKGKKVPEDARPESYNRQEVSGQGGPGEKRVGRGGAERRKAR